MHNTNYVIMVIEAAWYPVFLVITMVTVHFMTRHKEKQYQQAVENLVIDLKEIIYEEDVILNKNTLTLTDLVTKTATQEEYKEVADLLVKLFKKAYERDSYFLAKSEDEAKDANFLQIVSHYSEEPELHKEIFRKGMRYGIRMPELLKVFSLLVERGDLVSLGENATVILDDNTGNAPTGVSPINSGIEGGELSCIISFVKQENFPTWHENHFPKEEDNE